MQLPILIPSNFRLLLSTIVLLVFLSACSYENTTVLTAANPNITTGQLTIGQVTVEHRKQPLGIDSAEPRISWILRATYNAAKQSAYEIRVSSTADHTGDVWNSGRVSSDNSFDVVYDGPALQSRTRYFVSVRAWDGERQSNWSEPTWFETAFLDVADFKGDWIGRLQQRTKSETPEALLRTEFNLPEKSIASARMYIAGLGYYKAYLNGTRVSDHELDPGYTPFDRRVLYVTHDITGLLQSGANALGVSLGRGYYADYNNIDTEVAPWLSEPKLKLQLQVRFSDGTEQTLVSDASWKTDAGPTLTNSVKYGETYDARREQPGWQQTDFNDAEWQSALTVPAPTGELQAQDFEPIRVTGKLPAPTVTKVDDTISLYDFATTWAGWAKVRLSGPAGSQVVLKYGEKLTPQGLVNSGNDGPFGGIPVQVYRYTLSGDPNGEVYVPSYSYNGYRFLQVEKPSEVTIQSVEGVLLNNDIAVTGSFDSSSALLNRYHKAMVQSTLSNFHTIPTDTPMYEKRGWAADAMLIADNALMNFASENFWEKWMLDHRYNQAEDGGIAVIVPNQAPGKPQSDPFVGSTGDPIWSSSYVLVNYALYRQRGNLRTVQENYPGLKLWMGKWMQELATTNYLFAGKTWGDHEPAYGSGMDNYLVASAFIYRSAKALAEMATALRYDADASEYNAFAERVAGAINQQYYDAKKQHYDFPYQPPNMAPPPGVELPDELPEGFPFMPSLSPEEVDAKQFQTDNVLPLALDIVPPKDRKNLCQQLVNDVRVTQDTHITTGATVLKDVMPVLTNCGAAELAYQAAINPTAPGWGYWFQTLHGSKAVGGETIIVDTHWEAWYEHARSHNHAFRGTIDDWLYQYLAGITATSPAYRTIQIKPYLVGDLTYARASILTPLGEVSSNWQRRDSGLDMEVTIPVGASAEIYVPRLENTRITRADELELLRETDQYWVYQAGSGNYKIQTSQ